ncbi:hypothetical protein ACFYPH_18420 [Micromonospora sp. NPDC005252]|uniref:hypothetical protein n=1 Tax=unclassified Micromonospora TaxID=2617518 RepID=UPI0033AB29F7
MMQRELIKNREDRESLAVLSWFDCSHDLLDLALLEAGELEQARAAVDPLDEATVDSGHHEVVVDHQYVDHRLASSAASSWATCCWC